MVRWTKTTFIGCVLALAVLACPAKGADPENCLSCHRYRGLSRIDDDGKNIRTFYVDPNYYDRKLGPHARLGCTDCHDRHAVSVIPHQASAPVNCTTKCHLASPQHVEMEFGHDGIADLLSNSVHTPEVLETSNRLLGAPLPEGHSQCLLCHDEPQFRWSEQTPAHQDAAIGRCQACHEQLQSIDTQFFYWHVFARNRPARSNKTLTKNCAVCHSNSAIQDHFDMPDSTASYLASFHGKAMQLGSQETAGCLDCHAGKSQNVHAMLAHDQIGAPTSSEKLPTTCRSAACHPTAGHAVSTAAVHLDLALGRGLEYLIAALFVVLILFTFGPSLVLQTLELLQIIVGRKDPGLEDRLETVRRISAKPEGRRALQRFTPHQRIQHWVLFVSFTTLVLTGFPIKFADRAWAAWLVEFMGGLPQTRAAHRWAGVFLIAGFAFHILYIARAARQEMKRTQRKWIPVLLDLPMAMRWIDWKRFVHLLGYLLFLRSSRPEAGRFNLKEKFEYVGVFWGCTLLGMTGVLMWANAWTTQYFTGRVVTTASLIHTFEAFLALLHVGVIHMIGVVFSPSVFPLSKAMLTGETPEEELAESHSGFVARAAEKLNAAAGEVKTDG